jgi:hypothetical protein
VCFEAKERHKSEQNDSAKCETEAPTPLFELARRFLQGQPLLLNFVFAPRGRASLCLPFVHETFT